MACGILSMPTRRNKTCQHSWLASVKAVSLPGSTQALSISVWNSSFSHPTHPPHKFEVEVRIEVLWQVILILLLLFFFFSCVCAVRVSVIRLSWLLSHPCGVTVSGALHHSPRCFRDVLCLSHSFLCVCHNYVMGLPTARVSPKPEGRL